MKHFQAIAAMSLNRVIGSGGRIPWHLPEDFRWFKQKTAGHVVIMGRKTFESLGQPLPDRINIVLTRHPGRLRKEFPDRFGAARIGHGKFDIPRPFQFELPAMGQVRIADLRLVKSFLKLNLATSPLDFFICGGAQVYAQTLPLCSDLFLTVIKRELQGDTLFPQFEDRFKLVETLRDTPEFSIVHYRNKALTGEPAGGA